VAMKALLDLAHRDQIHLIGFLTWAFEFEGQPYFAGQRALATHGIDKPELNFFRMAGLLGGERVDAESSNAIPLKTILNVGVRQHPEIDALATRAHGLAAVMLWNYQGDAVAGPGTQVHVSIRGIPPAVHRALLLQYRIDENHSNAFTAWKQMGSPQHPDAEQHARLQAAGRLQQEGSPVWVTVKQGRLQMPLDLPRESVALLRVSWAVVEK